MQVLGASIFYYQTPPPSPLPLLASISLVIMYLVHIFISPSTLCSLNFILQNQDYDLPIAVLMCAIDFSKAFNRQNHNIIITLLSDMGVPGWLLYIVMGFLSDREMVVNFKGETSSKKPLPGGGPQGTLLGLLLFLVLVNFCGFMEVKLVSK